MQNASFIKLLEGIKNLPVPRNPDEVLKWIDQIKRDHLDKEGYDALIDIVKKQEEHKL